MHTKLTCIAFSKGKTGNDFLSFNFACLLLVEPAFTENLVFFQKSIFRSSNVSIITKGEKEENILGKYKLNCFVVETMEQTKL